MVLHSQNFELDQLETLTARFETISKTIISEKGKLEALEEQLATCEEELETFSASIEEAQNALEQLAQKLEAKNVELDQVKKAASKSTKTYDKTIKEIATHNDNIEVYASERFAIYKKCKLEEIDLPLEKGRLDRLPIEEHLPEEDDFAMEVDGTQDTQTAIQVKDYGIKVDYETLSEDAQEVSEDRLSN